MGIDENANTINSRNKNLFLAFLPWNYQCREIKNCEITNTNDCWRAKFLKKLRVEIDFYICLKILCFNINKVTADSDKLYKIQETCDMLRQSFQKIFHFLENLRIDESLLLYKRKLSFKQYISSKRNRFGIKSFILCDTWIYNLIFYNLVKHWIVNCESEIIGKSHTIVVRLLKPYLNKDHKSYMDNCYTSLILFILLHKNRINAGATVRKRRHANYPK